MNLDPADKQRMKKMKLRIVSPEKLEESRVRREEWNRQFGWRPTSIWDIGHKANWKHSKVLQRLMDETVASNTYLTGSISKGRVLVPTVKSASQFPLELARRIVLFWSDEGDRVFDPFSGMGERMQVTAHLGRTYYGYDISKKFHEQKIKLINKKTLFPFKGNRFIWLRDSRDNRFRNEEFDFSYTSPPYWNIEVKAYGDESEQLGLIKTYPRFLVELEKIIKENIRVVKRGKYIVWVVGDFRREGKLIPFHMDITKLFMKNGCSLHDIIIYEMGTLSAAFLKPLIDQKHMGKTHEYILVFKK